MIHAVLGHGNPERLDRDTVDPLSHDWCPETADAPNGNVYEHPPAVHLKQPVILDHSQFVKP